MKKTFIKFCTSSMMILGLIFVHATGMTYAEEGSQQDKEFIEYHDFISKEEFKRLSDQGYTKKDILKAAHIAKYTNQKVDDVLKIYKEHNSWEKTAKHYGLDMEKLKEKCHDQKEKFLEEHMEEVVENIAEYSGKTEEQIQSWMKEGIPLRFIFAGAAMAKAGNKDLADIIKLKKDGQSYKELKKNLNIDRDQLRREMKNLMMMIKEDIKD